jgi:hypothetical protein
MAEVTTAPRQNNHLIDPDGNVWLLQEFPSEMRQPGQSFYHEGNASTEQSGPAGTAPCSRG